jgi:hypothetical protein
MRGSQDDCPCEYGIIDVTPFSHLRATLSAQCDTQMLLRRESGDSRRSSGDETDADFDRRCRDMVRTEPCNFRIHPVAALTTLSALRDAPNLGGANAQATHGPSPTLKDGTSGLSIAI